MRFFLSLVLLLLILCVFLSPLPRQLSNTANAQGSRSRPVGQSPQVARRQVAQGDQRHEKRAPRITRSKRRPANDEICPSSPFSAPDTNDALFVVDCAPLLDTDCTFKDEVPDGALTFDLQINRVVGDVTKLRANGLIASTAKLRLPAFDVDFFGGGGQINPERDIVSLNGHVVPSEFLTGDDEIWKLNEFTVPIDWLNFPEDPGPDGTLTPADNIVEIQIDTANQEPEWCTAIDWASLSIQAARPVVFVHGIFSSGAAWDQADFSWTSTLTNRFGLPNSNRLSMGSLDSIGNNASKIAGEVAASKVRWGVDKVNLVTHSKGGLDSREYVEGNNDVEQLIQLGTPNAGSPLADWVQEKSIETVGFVPTVLINLLAGPAGVQLTTPYMSYYNNHHGSNPQVTYIALAGNYNPDCFFLDPFCRPLERFLLNITGPGDTIVPISSVHALSYTQDRTFNSSGEDEEATHTGLNHSQAVFNTVFDRVARFGTNKIEPTFLNPQNDPSDAAQPSASTVAVGGSISQGEIQQKTLEIDQSTLTSFRLLYASGTLDLALISPSGQRFDASTVTGNPNVSHEKIDILGGFIDSFDFGAPEVGVWTVEVKGTSVTTQGGLAGYAVSALIQQPSITFTGSADKLNIHINDKLRLFGTLLSNNAPLTGASVSARISLPDNTMQQLVMHDDGLNGDVKANDGVYTGDLTATSQSGNYSIAYMAHKAASAGSPAFSRDAFAIATVSQSDSTIGNTFTDFGVDTDADGLFNVLTIQAPLNITAAGNYRIFGQLMDSNNNVYEVNVTANLSPGQVNVPLQFDGASIYKNRVNGPYRLTVIRLAEDTGSALMPVDEHANAYQTAAYDFHSFQHAPITLTGTGSAAGVDTNGNNAFDILHVTLSIEVSTAGFYSWSASLEDRVNTEIGFASNSGNLVAGTNTITLDFDGASIGQNGVDGPYIVESFLIFGPDNSLVSPQAFTTPALKASQFEGFTFTYGDLNGDGSVTVTDLVVLANALAGNITITTPAGDVFKDGKLDITDLVTLANFLAGNIQTIPVIPGLSRFQNNPTELLVPNLRDYGWAFGVNNNESNILWASDPSYREQKPEISRHGRLPQ